MTTTSTLGRTRRPGLLVAITTIFPGFLIACILLFVAASIAGGGFGVEGPKGIEHNGVQIQKGGLHYDPAPVRGIYTFISHNHSPAYNGSDVSYLQDGQTTTNSVLSACNIERDSRWVVAKGYNSANGGQYFRAYDYSADGQCEANFTGENLEWHKIKEEGGEYGGTSYH